MLTVKFTFYKIKHLHWTCAVHGLVIEIILHVVPFDIGVRMNCAMHMMIYRIGHHEWCIIKNREAIFTHIMREFNKGRHLSRAVLNQEYYTDIVPW